MEEDFGRAFELLTDLVFHSQFPKQEIEKEVAVILDETIRMRIVLRNLYSTSLRTCFIRVMPSGIIS